MMKEIILGFLSDAARAAAVFMVAFALTFGVVMALKFTSVLPIAINVTHNQIGQSQ